MRELITRRPSLAAALAALCLLSSSVPPTGAAVAKQRKRDPLTTQEADMVREAQQLEARTSLFIKIAERRLAAVTGGEQRQPVATWGELPKGGRGEYLSDLAAVLDEAIENVDDVASRNPESQQVAKSVRKLADASARFITQLMPLREKIADGPERESLERALDNLQSVIEAAKKVPDEPEEKKPGKKG